MQIKIKANFVGIFLGRYSTKCLFWLSWCHNLERIYGIHHDLVNRYGISVSWEFYVLYKNSIKYMSSIKFLRNINFDIFLCWGFTLELWPSRISGQHKKSLKIPKYQKDNQNCFIRAFNALESIFQVMICLFSLSGYHIKYVNKTFTQYHRHIEENNIPQNIDFHRLRFSTVNTKMNTKLQ
jgi:hypothetical protein